MSWQFLILLHAFAGAFLILQSRAIARMPKARHASLAVNAVAFSALFVVGVLIALINGPAEWLEVKEFWSALVGSGICFAVGSMFIYRALVYLDSAIVSVLTTITAMFTLILAGLFLGERLTILQLLGSLLLLPTIWYVLSLASKEKQGINIHNRALLRGVSYALLASLTYALGFVLEKYAVTNVSISTYLVVGWGSQLVTAWLCVLLLRRQTLKVLLIPAITRQAIQLGVIRAAAGSLFLFALVKSNNVTLMSVISNFRIIVVAILAGILLKEREHYTEKLTAAAIAFVALGIIFWN